MTKKGWKKCRGVGCRKMAGKNAGRCEECKMKNAPLKDPLDIYSQTCIHHGCRKQALTGLKSPYCTGHGRKVEKKGKTGKKAKATKKVIKRKYDNSYLPRNKRNPPLDPGLGVFRCLIDTSAPQFKVIQELCAEIIKARMDNIKSNRLVLYPKDRDATKFLKHAKFFLQKMMHELQSGNKLSYKQFKEDIPNPVVFHPAVTLAQAGRSRRVPLHRDNVEDAVDNFLTCVVCLEEQTDENGTLEVYLNSRRLPNDTKHPDRVMKWLGNPSPMKMVGPPGTMFVFDGGLLHRPRRNKSNQDRYHFLFQITDAKANVDLCGDSLAVPFP